jgi:hypothetical protein
MESLAGIGDPGHHCNPLLHQRYRLQEEGFLQVREPTPESEPKPLF